MSSFRLFGLLGHYLAHSFSAKYFNNKFIKDGLNCKYENFDIPELPNLNKLLESNLNLSGLNVTIPYKKQIIEQLDSIEEDAKKIGAVNVIQINNGTFKGYNTDYLAFTRSVSPLIDKDNTKAMILGTGGASRAVTYAFEKLNVPYSLVSREKGNSDYIYENIDSKILNDHNLIVNTTPLGNHPNVNELPNIPYKYLKTKHVLFDLTYNPEITEFLKKGLFYGCKTKNGYDMLVRQAELSWEIWNQ